MSTNSDAKSLFLSLTSGLKFNSKKYKSDIDKFKHGKASKVGDLTGINGDSKVSSFVPVQSLDFFGSSNSQQNSNDDSSSQKKKKKNKKQEDVNASESDIEDDDDDSEAVARSDEESESNVTQISTPELTDLEQVQQLRLQHKIFVRGNDPIAAPVVSFDELAPYLRKYLLKNIKSEYANPTPVQMQTLPILINKKEVSVKDTRELLVSAPTGSGKTASFVIPILHHLRNPDKSGFRAVVIAPTRVLAEQIYQVFNTFAKGKKWSIRCVTDESLSKLREQLSSMKNDILVATPLKLITLIQEKILSLANVQRLIFDEADRLFDMGFAEQIDEVIAACSNPNLVKCLFSATIPLGVEQLASTILRDPIRISIGVKNTGAETITQKLLFCGTDSGKLLALRARIREGLKPPVLIFVQSIDRARQLYNELLYDNYSVDYIHGGRSEKQTRQVVNNFRLGKTWALISTDVMARGLDFKGVSCVINYDFPVSMVSYIHRIGRTGRAGQHGEAITYFTYDDIPLLKNIANVMRKSGCEVPDWMLNMKKVSSRELASTVIKQATTSSGKNSKHSTGKRKNGNNNNNNSRNKTKQTVPDQAVSNKRKAENNGSSTKLSKPAKKAKRQ